MQVVAELTTNTPLHRDKEIQWPVGEALWFLCVLALLPLLGYQFGVGNQVEQFSLIERVLDPTFIPNDFFVDTSIGFGPRFYFVRLVAAIASVTSVPIAVLVLALVANLALAVITFAAAKTLCSASRWGSALAATLAITNAGFSLGLAAFVRFDSFQPANLAVPLGLAGVLLILARRRVMLGALLLVLSSMMHPLIGAETAGFLFVAAAIHGSSSDRRALLAPGVLTVTLMAAVWAGPRLLWPPAEQPTADLFALMARFRAPHHYLALTFPTTHYIAFGLFAVAIGILGIRHLRDREWRAPSRALVTMVVGVLGFCLASAYFVDLRHSSLWVMAQAFRMLLLVKWIGFLLVGAFLGDLIAEDVRFGWVAAAVVLLAPAEVLGAIVLMGMGVAALPADFRSRYGLPLALLMSAVVLLCIGHLHTVSEAVRPAAAVIALGAMAIPAKRWGSMIATAGVAVLLLGVVSTRRQQSLPWKAFHPTFSWYDVVTPAAEAARWARAHTDASSAWVIPPELETFRLLARRAVVVDFTSVPLSNGGMVAWRERITEVYGAVTDGGFSGLHQMQAHWRTITPDQLAALAPRFGVTHALLYAETPWSGPVLFQNARFKIVAL